MRPGGLWWRLSMGSGPVVLCFSIPRVLWLHGDGGSN